MILDGRHLELEVKSNKGENCSIESTKKLINISFPGLIQSLKKQAVSMREKTKSDH